MRLCVLLLLSACHVASTAADAGGTADGGGKRFTGPPNVELGTGDTAFVPLQDPQTLTLLDQGDGGWALPLSVQASNVDAQAQLRFTLQDGASLSPLMPAVELATTLVLQDSFCLGLGLRLPIEDVTALQTHPVFWVDVQLVDGLLRQAHGRGRVTVMGGPPRPDGGPLDADASLVGMDAAVGG